METSGGSIPSESDGGISFTVKKEKKFGSNFAIDTHNNVSP